MRSAIVNLESLGSLISQTMGLENIQKSPAAFSRSKHIAFGTFDVHATAETI